MRVNTRSLYEQYGAIRHLDAARARELVDSFRRPIAHDGRRIGCPASDPIAAEAGGRVTMARGDDRDHSSAIVAFEKTNLHLHGLRRLPLSVARELVRHPGNLYLDGLATITEGVAVVLAGHVGGGLSLDGLRTISQATAIALAGHGGELSLNGLPDLCEATARGLSRHAHALTLNGLESLGSSAAAALACHRGNLYLGGLADLSDAAARHLARHTGHVHLHRVSILLDGAAEALGQRIGYLCLKGLARLSARQAVSLAGHRGELHLPALHIDDAVADALGRHHGSLLVRVPATLPLHRLAALVRHEGPLEISGLSTLDEPRARLLAAQAGPRGIRGLSCLFIDGVEQISPAVAAILATHTAGGLALTDITELTDDVARELVKHPILALDRVTRVSDQVASILATHAGGTLSLRGLKEVSPWALALLKATPSVELAAALAGFNPTP